jgi:U3 small nucleolar RNA-associated protein 25
LESLSSGAPPQAKRRKIGHVPGPDVVESVNETVPSHVEQDEDSDDDDDALDTSDPFETHFADPDDNTLAQRLAAIQQKSWSSHKVLLANSGTAVISLPKTNQVKDSYVLGKAAAPVDLKIHKKLAGIVSRQRPNFNDLESSIAPLIFNYEDFLFCERTVSNSDDLRRLVCLHAINHIYK